MQHVAKDPNELSGRNILHSRLGLFSESIHEQLDAAIADQIGWPACSVTSSRLTIIASGLWMRNRLHSGE